MTRSILSQIPWGRPCLLPYYLLNAGHSPARYRQIHLAQSPCCCHLNFQVWTDSWFLTRTLIITASISLYLISPWIHPWAEARPSKFLKTVSPHFTFMLLTNRNRFFPGLTFRCHHWFTQVIYSNIVFLHQSLQFLPLLRIQGQVNDSFQTGLHWSRIEHHHVANRNFSLFLL